jgi:hypothetical protein
LAEARSVDARVLATLSLLGRVSAKAAMPATTMTATTIAIVRFRRARAIWRSSSIRLRLASSLRADFVWRL